VVAVLVAIFFYIKFYFVFTEGVKTGHLNYIIKKGYIFKTYEGKMIQSGFKTVQSGYIQSNEFEFSIQNQRLADSLMRMDENKEIILYYKEYLGAIPWRGYSKYIVDSIVSVRDIIPQGRQEIIPPVPPFE
jgi:hypothetical protein